MTNGHILSKTINQTIKMISTYPLGTLG